MAIATSPVPPLAVVGLSLESEPPSRRSAPSLLFGTNVGAIIATGTVVFLLHGARRRPPPVARRSASSGRVPWVSVAAAVVVVAVPLGWGSSLVVQQEVILSRATPVATAWAEAGGGQGASVDITVRHGVLRITAPGPPPTIQGRPG
ncbi:MAG: hypothetical protein U0R79_10760 [Propionicimonas sp.]